jgi:pimeloyl-ACP methyl ester carboxylesterase
MPIVNTGEVKLHYEEAGSGPEHVVLVHGFVRSSKDWAEVARHLAAADFHVFAFDLRGCGQSERPSSGYSSAVYADDIAAATAALGIETFHCAGHSLGGLVGMQVALRHPDRLRSLTLVAPAPSDGLKTRNETTPAEVLELFRQARTSFDAGLSFVEALSVRPVKPEVLRAAVDAMLAASEGHVEETWADLGALDLSGRLSKIAVPTLVAAGDRDALKDDNLADHARIPNCGLQVFYRVGHDIPLEAPAELAEVMVDFLRNGTAAAIDAQTLRDSLSEAVAQT